MGSKGLRKSGECVMKGDSGENKEGKRKGLGGKGIIPLTF
jgi:hypothetical protein